MAHPDFDPLVNWLLPFAKQMLAENGEFHPFAAMMKTDGEIVAVGVQLDDGASTQEVLDFMVQALRAEATRGEIKASGICLDVRTIPPGSDQKTDAICVRLEHVEGDTVEVYLPYRKKFFGKIAFGELFAARGECAIFPTPQA